MVWMKVKKNDDLMRSYKNQYTNRCHTYILACSHSCYCVLLDSFACWWFFVPTFIFCYCSCVVMFLCCFVFVSSFFLFNIHVRTAKYTFVFSIAMLLSHIFNQSDHLVRIWKRGFIAILGIIMLNWLICVSNGREHEH